MWWRPVGEISLLISMQVRRCGWRRGGYPLSAEKSVCLYHKMFRRYMALNLAYSSPHCIIEQCVNIFYQWRFITWIDRMDCFSIKLTVFFIVFRSFWPSGSQGTINHPPYGILIWAPYWSVPHMVIWDR